LSIQTPRSISPVQLPEKFMRFKHLLSTAAALSSFSLGSHAASVSWSLGPNFGGANGHQGILTNGRLVQAVNLTGQVQASVVVDPGGLNISFSNVDSPFFGNFSMILPPVSPTTSATPAGAR